MVTTFELKGKNCASIIYTVPHNVVVILLYLNIDYWLCLWQLHLPNEALSSAKPSLYHGGYVLYPECL